VTVLAGTTPEIVCQNADGVSGGKFFAHWLECRMMKVLQKPAHKNILAVLIATLKNVS
jgi:hypothetical protein